MQVQISRRIPLPPRLSRAENLKWACTVDSRTYFVIARARNCVRNLLTLAQILKKRAYGGPPGPRFVVTRYDVILRWQHTAMLTLHTANWEVEPMVRVSFLLFFFLSNCFPSVVVLCSSSACFSSPCFVFSFFFFFLFLSFLLSSFLFCFYLLSPCGYFTFLPSRWLLGAARLFVSLFSFLWSFFCFLSSYSLYFLLSSSSLFSCLLFLAFSSSALNSSSFSLHMSVYLSTICVPVRSLLSVLASSVG